ncbi:MAG: hypothetical protein AABX13_05945 [Nanoarchaeota archaeon]
MLATAVFTAISTAVLMKAAAAVPEQLPEQLPDSLISQLPLEIDAGALQPLVDVIRPLLLKASLLVGGIFGIYIILILVRIHYERRNMKLLQQIRYDLDQQNYHYGIPSSLEKKGFWHRLIVDGLSPAHRQKHNTLFPKQQGKEEKKEIKKEVKKEKKEK